MLSILIYQDYWEVLRNSINETEIAWLALFIDLAKFPENSDVN